MVEDIEQGPIIKNKKTCIPGIHHICIVHVHVMCTSGTCKLHVRVKITNYTQLTLDFKLFGTVHDYLLLVSTLQPGL